MSVAPAAVFPALQEARKWVNRSKRRAHPNLVVEISLNANHCFQR